MSDEEKFPSKSLVTSVDAAKILGISKQRIQQLVIDKLLPPRFVFNKESRRKFYLFDRKIILKFLDEKQREHVKWVEPEESSLLSIPDAAESVGCPQTWVYEAMRNDRLVPEIVVKGDGKRGICLFKRETVEKAWKIFNETKGKRGYREKTLKMIEKIKRMYSIGMNDSEIASSLGVKQPFIARLRKELGLPALCGRGRPRSDA